MKQHHILFKKREDNLVVGFLLRGIKLLYVVKMRLATMIEATNLALVRHEQAAVYEVFQRGRRAVGGVKKLVARHFHYLLACGRSLNGFPTAHGEEAGEGLVLLLARRRVSKAT